MTDELEHTKTKARFKGAVSILCVLSSLCGWATAQLLTHPTFDSAVIHSFMYMLHVQSIESP
jgi:hypothetical protein